MAENINSNEVVICPSCGEPFPETKARGNTPIHQIFDSLKVCSGTGKELQVRTVAPGEVVRRTELLVH